LSLSKKVNSKNKQGENDGSVAYIHRGPNTQQQAGSPANNINTLSFPASSTLTVSVHSVGRHFVSLLFVK